MLSLKRLAPVAVALPLIGAGLTAAPHAAKAWWVGGLRVGIAIPPVVVAPPPVYAAPPVYYAPPPVVAYAPAPRHVWVPGYWRGPYWIPGHWA